MDEDQAGPETDPMAALALKLDEQLGETQDEESDDPDAEGSADDGEADPGDGADGDDDPDAEGSEDDAPTGRYKVTVPDESGQLVEQNVTFDELRAGYQRGREAEAARSAAQAEVSRTFEQANQFVAQVQQAGEAKLAQLSMLVMKALEVTSPEDLLSLAQSDPAAYHQAAARQGVLQSVQRQIAQAQEQLQAQTQQQEAQRNYQKREVALKALAKAGITTAQVDKIYESAGKAYGYSPQELAANLDHRLVLLLKDAADMKALRDKRPQIQNKVRTAPKAPPLRKSAQLEAQKLVGRLSKPGGGSREDLAALLRMRG